MATDCAGARAGAADCVLLAEAVEDAPKFLSNVSSTASSNSVLSFVSVMEFVCSDAFPAILCTIFRIGSI